MIRYILNVFIIHARARLICANPASNLDISRRCRRERKTATPMTYLGVYDRTYHISDPAGVMAEKPFACPRKL